LFYDDILISGTNKDEHDRRLVAVLDRLRECGITVKKEKCELFKTSLVYLGYELNRNGIKIPDSKIRAIKEAAVPKNRTELRSFLGFVNFYSKFIEHMSSIVHPLYQLLQNNVEFRWQKKHNQAFELLKSKITSSEVLEPFNPELQLILTCDASPYGIGAVLTHQLENNVEKPIAFASRTLKESEKNYSQLDKEALALVFGVQHFHQYLYMNKFTLRTDHKPLTTIFGNKKGIPSMTANRLQRYAVFLSNYNYEIEYIKGEENKADLLSRLPLEDHKKNTDTECTYFNFICDDVPLMNEVSLGMETKNDKVLSEVYQRVLKGEWTWKDKMDPELKPYYTRRQEIYIEGNKLMLGHRVIIPSKLQSVFLQELHTTHMGIVKMKSIGRSYIWWPNIDQNIEEVVKRCTSCLAENANPPKSELHKWPWPSTTNQRVHIDFCGPVNNTMFVIIIDSHSKWIFVKQMKDITTKSTIKVLREYFSYWGVPVTIVSDNGTSLVSDEMRRFLKEVGVKHVTTAPYHPASNGAAENGVKTFKQFLKKALREENNIDKLIANFIIQYNNTVHCTTGFTPAELHVGRKLPTRLDRMLMKDDVCIRNEERQIKNFRGGRNVSLEYGEIVMIRNYSRGNKWIEASVTKQISPVTYLLTGKNGYIYIKDTLTRSVKQNCQNLQGKIEHLLREIT
jgi:hypothetical protein